ncbi:hypothetical protein [Sandarakinorhabdus limnophila]|jgi:hypothetical protein|uniref:hypothetical protein n=1 Tax=Sandarakinorhabdus limnophila TaxID=210512 RepID=UPI0026EA1384|nr:hypothetical protein [Sandarakinorhabdus limnophila]MCM0032744.1 hypothetical protein [Sandarakinorhabdus limnophila]
MREAPLPAAEAKKRYLVYLAVRLTGLAVMAAGVWLVREVGQAPGLAVVLLGGCSLFVRPKHLGLTRK